MSEPAATPVFVPPAVITVWQAPDGTHHVSIHANQNGVSPMDIMRALADAICQVSNMDSGEIVPAGKSVTPYVRTAPPQPAPTAAPTAV